MKKGVGNSFRVQMVISVFGVFALLVVSTTYILFSTIRIQSIIEESFEKERYLKSIQEALQKYQGPLLEYLSSRSSNALAQHLIESQNLKDRLPDNFPILKDPGALRERELYILIQSYLELAEKAVELKRGRNIEAYITLYDELSNLLTYINNEIERINSERFRNQIDQFGIYINHSRNILQWNLLFIICISLFSISLLLRSVEKMTAPMVHLSAMASELSSGNFAIEDIKMSSIHEIDRVVAAFNQMKHEIGHYIEEIKLQETIKQEYLQERMRNLKMQELLRRMEIYTLQSQMNPHFLFNTLNTGVQLAIIEGAERTSEFMENLALLFRHNIKNKESLVPLRYEIEGLQYYFYILKIRFSHTLHLVLDYPEDILDAYKVPVSILQPLVENSIVHAFKSKEDQKEIIVRVEKDADYIILNVIDNGCGMSEDTIYKLLHPLPIEESSTRIMGLENVIQRLRFYYPEEPEVISIKSSPGEGTHITIKIPRGKEPCIEY
ncbi:histidine kinase [Treponema sp. J25]|uniref:sensor histidine kinase n=1 Tax=Treponema sp. J25 TaxID=2094121 RepID=UPI00104E5E6A|nr:histidine kinase [Treponema sp. J25]MCX7656383.1 histidine kinase [Treponemataceae bacterium]TCW61758.1 two-component sensor histidine kinase [Treponema sp. J25]